MSALTDQIETDGTDILLSPEEFGRTVTYTQGGSDYRVPAVVTHSETVEEQQEDGYATVHRGTAVISSAGGHIRAPSLTDTLTVDDPDGTSRTWEVSSIRDYTPGGLVALDIMRVDGRKTGRAVHRDRR